MGLDVAVHYRSSSGPAEETASACRARGVRATTVGGDLGSAGRCARTWWPGAGRSEGIDVLVNSADDFVRPRRFEDTTEEKTSTGP